jgi:transcriptional regulator with XRE-family HTH domain
MALTVLGTMPRKKQPQTEFGERLVALRQQRALTQVQLAEVAGLTQRAISYWETMPGYPAAPAIVALAKALRVSSDELLGIKALPRSATAVQAPEEKRLWKKLRLIAALPERDQRAVLRIIDSATLATQARRSA